MPAADFSHRFARRTFMRKVRSPRVCVTRLPRCARKPFALITAASTVASVLHQYWAHHVLGRLAPMDCLLCVDLCSSV